MTVEGGGRKARGGIPGEELSEKDLCLLRQFAPGGLQHAAREAFLDIDARVLERLTVREGWAGVGVYRVDEAAERVEVIRRGRRGFVQKVLGSCAIIRRVHEQKHAPR